AADYARRTRGGPGPGRSRPPPLRHRAAGRERNGLLRRVAASQMSLYAHLFGDCEVAAHLSDQARIQAMLDVEAALAEAEASVGMIPPAPVEAIRAAARAQLYDRGLLARELATAGNISIPPVENLTQRVAAGSAEAARFVHWGATSQDVIDTGFVLQLRAACPPLLGQIDRAARAAAEHARRHVST